MNNEPQDNQTSTRAGRKSGRSRRFHPWRWFWGIIVLLLLVIAGFGAVAYHNINSASDKAYKSAGINKARDTKAVLKDKRPISIMFLGTDTGALGRTEKGRTDTIMVATINPQTNKMLLVSLPRDTMTDIAGYPNQSPAKINAAYSIGDVGTTIKTVQNLLNVPIDYYALLNMGGLEKSIDEVGGVTVTSPLTFNYEGASFVKDQTYHMNGSTALKFARMRYDDPQNDYGRQNRQRLVVQALFRKSISVKTVLNPSFLNSISSESQTDLQSGDLVKLAQNYRSATKNMTTDHMQGQGQMINGQSFEVVSSSEKQRVTNELRKSLDLSAKADE
ncbi:LCP family glycopolymer transferase [Furfurilactobacillus siliginis]|uniref:LytR family transcriptional regulator n=1 Tax=Furfurilactobacillus siliginis TaxID=348151 RepID=A0A0R2L227_9LACO|nr:LCP family protein [Furfurilactobacillus siliginis]KRN95755.1 transcriptional regulator lytr [Furfurilactobacillus siliginis]GEK28969.1 LytR family transcriptional regulator [Furfurilactobacillus siliginis]